MIAHVYFAMLALFVAHELDAVKRHEWRVLPLTSFLPEKPAEQIFIWAHVPLFWGLFHFGAGDPTSSVAIGLSAFAVVHVGLHVLFMRHEKYEFNTVSSWALILGAGVFGAAHLSLVYL